MAALAPILDALESGGAQRRRRETAFRRQAAERTRCSSASEVTPFGGQSAAPDRGSRGARREEEMAVAGSQAILRAKLGWSNDSEARSVILTRFATVVKGMFATLHPDRGEAERTDRHPGSAGRVRSLV
jgi:hypothetical protein